MATSSLHATTVATLRDWRPTDLRLVSLCEAYLGFLLAREDACQRTCVAGHVTVSCLLFDADHRHVALVLHGIAGVWIVPGGHLEAEDDSLVAAAAREVREELGVVVECDPEPLDLDCHAFTCRNSPPTRHFDVDFLAVAAPGTDLVCSEESREVRWWPVDRLPTDVPRLPHLVQLGLARLARS